MAETRSITPAAGRVEERAAPEAPAPRLEGRTLHGLVPYGAASRDLGGWTEVIEPGALAGARMDDLVLTVDHAGLPLARYPATLTLEDTPQGMAWSAELPNSPAGEDVRVAVERGDLVACSWRMVVGLDYWTGDCRHVQRIDELLDVSVVTTPAYGTALAELRNRPTADPDAPHTHSRREAAPMHEHDDDRRDDDRRDTTTTTPAPRDAEDRQHDRDADEPGGDRRDSRPRGRLRVEDRDVTTQAPVEARVLDAMAAVPRGEARDLVTASGTGTAAPITPEEHGSFVWDNLRQAAVILQSGVRVLTTDRSELRWPVIREDAAADFRAELELIPEDSPVLDEIVAIPRAIKALIRASSEAFDDSDPALRAVLQQHLTAVLATRLDAEFIAGAATGTDGFPGMANLTGSLTVNDAATTTASWDAVLRAIGALRDANVSGDLAVVLHPRTALALSLAKDGDGLPIPRPQAIPEPLISAALPLATGRATALVYAPQQIAVVRRQDALVEIDRSREFDTDGVLIRGKVRATMAVPHSKAVCRIGAMPAPNPAA